MQSLLKSETSLIFFGSSDFSVPSLRELYKNFVIKAVVTTPDKPAGRGLKLKKNPVKIAAEELGLKISEPENLKDDEFIESLHQLSPDFIVLVSYGKILPKEILEIPKIEAINLHPSLLPKYRGAAPIQRVLMNGEEITGITIISMNEEIDAGEILLQKAIKIEPCDNYDTLSKRLAEEGSRLLLEAIKKIKNKEIIPIPQDSSKATYAPKIRKEERLIDWNKECLKIHNLVRGLSTKFPAYTFFRKKRLEILETALDKKGKGIPGEIIQLNKDLYVGCKDGSLKILKLKPEGKKIMTGKAFLHGYKPKEKERLGSKESSD